MRRRNNNLCRISGALLALAMAFFSVAKAEAASPDTSGYSLSASPNAVEQDGVVTISWSKPDGDPYGFIGLYNSTNAGTFGFLDFVYPVFSGNSGTVSLQVPHNPGGYWLRWVSESDSQFKATTFFQVIIPHTVLSTPGYSLSAAPNPVNSGDTLIVNWVKPGGASGGFIGLYDSTEDNSPLEGVSGFLDIQTPSNSGTSGAVSFVVPSLPGGYWLGWVSADTSQFKSIIPFSVTTDGEDKAAPTVSLTSPADGATVSGQAVTVSADADDNIGVIGVQFQLDGVNLGAEDQSSPYSIAWDTTTSSNGSHSLTAVARDAAGNQTVSPTITLTLNNVLIPPGPLGKASPANGAAGNSVNSTLSWGASSGAISYEYCLDTINNNSCDSSWTSTAGTSAAVSGLNVGTTYFWQVRARNVAGTTFADGGVWWSFTTSASHVNVAAAANGAVASASSTYDTGHAPDGAINGDRKGLAWGNGGGWNDGTEGTFPDWLQVDFAGPQTINEIDVFTLQDDFANPIQPALGMPFNLYGITDFQIQYWDGFSWDMVPGGNISGNNQVWRQIAFGAITTTKIRVYVTGALASFSRITEVEAYSDLNVLPGTLAKSSPANAATGQAHVPTLHWGTSSAATSYEYCVDTTNNNNCDTGWISTSGATSVTLGGLNAGTTYYWQVRARNGAGTTNADSNAWWSFTTSVAFVNVASAANGAVATASSSLNSLYAPGGAIDGDRKGTNWGNGGGWNDGTPGAFPDWLQVNFAGAQAIDEIDVFTLQDNPANPVEPTLGMPFTLYGITDFQVQYWDGQSWAVVPGGDFDDNNQVWRQITFAAITTTMIRINVTGALNSSSRITEVEAYSDLNAMPGPLAKNGPANAATGQVRVPTLSWGTSSAATSYEYCVDTTNNNSCDTSWTSAAGATSAVVSGLNSGTTYFWQVRARNTAGTIEADGNVWWSFTTSVGSHINVAAAVNGAIASASSVLNAGYAPAGAVDGDRKGTNWGNGGGWSDGTSGTFPDWLEVDFAGPQAIDEIDVFTAQDDIFNPIEPALGMPFTLYGITAFEVQYWDGTDWVRVPGGDVDGNNQVWRQFEFGAITTTKIRILVVGAQALFSRIAEVEAYSNLNGIPGTLAKSSPANGATGKPVNPMLSWGNSFGASSYEYCVNTTASCGTTWTSTGSATTAVLSGLSAGVTYFWQVRARNGAGTVEADGSVWWSFTVNPAKLTVSKSGTGSGAVTSSPAGIDCGVTCSAFFTPGQVVALTATASPGASFIGWSGDADCMDGSVTVTAGINCVAVFGGVPHSDFNGDGKSDILWQNTDGSSAVWLMNGTGLTSGGGMLGPGTGWTIKLVGDFNGDGKSDILWQNTDGSSAIWLMNGIGQISGTVVLGPGTGWSAVQIGDFNGDGKSDIVWQNTDGSTAIWLMNGLGISSGTVILGPGTGWSVAKVGDFDGDGKSDIVWQHTDGSAAMWLMNGLSMSSAGGLQGPGTGWSVVKIGDFDGDGKSDIVWQNTDGSTAMWLMNGLVLSSRGVLLGPATGWSLAQVGDFNGDGKTDIVWQNVDGSTAMWLMNGLTMSGGGGLLVPATGWSVKQIGDFNGDGKSDIVWLNTDGSSAVWLMNGLSLSSGGGLLGPGTGWSPAP